MSPSSSGRASGMPWHTTWLTEVQRDLGEACVLQRGRVHAEAQALGMHLAVHCVGGDAGLQQPGGEVADVAGVAAGASHGGDGGGGLDLDAALTRLTRVERMSWTGARRADAGWRQAQSRRAETACRRIGLGTGRLEWESGGLNSGAVCSGVARRRAAGLVEDEEEDAEEDDEDENRA